MTGTPPPQLPAAAPWRAALVGRVRARIGRGATRGLTWAMLALVLASCASTPRTSPDSIVGRLVLQVSATDTEAARIFSAGFELRGEPAAGQLDLLAPTGTVVARARWQPGAAQLDLGQGPRNFPSLAELTQRALGERLPMEALFDWLQGRPWSALPHALRPQGFEQAGWEVDISALPRGNVVARRDSRPAVTLRMRVEPAP